MNQKMKWDKRYLRMALNVAEWSKDTSTKVGCLLVHENDGTPLTFAYNGMPRGVNDDVPERHVRPEKYKWMTHAERNAIANCSRRGIATLGSTAYVTLMPCGVCAGELIQAGVKRVVWIGTNEEITENRWNWTVEFETAMKMFQEAEIDICVYTREMLDEDGSD